MNIKNVSILVFVVCVLGINAILLFNKDKIIKPEKTAITKPAFFDPGFIPLKDTLQESSIALTVIDSCQYIILSGRRGQYHSVLNIVHHSNCRNLKHKRQ